MEDSSQQLESDNSALLVRLIEEDLFLDHIDKCSATGAASISADQRYLVENVFPTLVPALQQLIKQYQHQITPSGPDGAVMAATAASSKSQADPVMWLAQYLLRNNARSSTSRLGQHPFQVINQAALNRNQNEI